MHVQLVFFYVLKSLFERQIKLQIKIKTVKTIKAWDWKAFSETLIVLQFKINPINSNWYKTIKVNHWNTIPQVIELENWIKKQTTKLGNKIKLKYI